MKRWKFFYIWILFLSGIGTASEYVTCDFRGQLGNQMWTVAAAIGYALDHGCIPVFPGIKSAINGELNYQYIFHRLNISPMPEGNALCFFQESHSHTYDVIPYYPNKNMCLVGHFESPKYFEKHADYIRDVFGPTQEILEYIDQKYGQLLKEPTVAVHVRTYIPDWSYPNMGGSNWGYFITAMNYFPNETHFVVFSDAMEWTKAHFPKKEGRVTFIEGNPHYIDLYLMSLCTHFIVSPESAFSWWAAWLNRNPNKIVIVADAWGGLFENDTIPSGWLKLPKQAPFFFIK